MRKMGLEPTRHRCHKILSLARLPVPTLPQLILSPALSRADLCILSKVQHVVKSFFQILSISFVPGQKQHPGDACMASPGCYHQRYSLQRYFRSKSSIQRGLSYRYPWIISIFIWSRAFSCLGSSTPSTTTFTSMVPARSETVLMKASEN